MKKHIVIIAAAMMLAACSGRNSSDADTQSADSVGKSDSIEVKANNDSLSVDAVSSATNVANTPTFNGVLMVAPQNNATV